jgi:hypothetical protein
MGRCLQRASHDHQTPIPPYATSHTWPRPPGSSSVLILLAKSETSSIQGQHAQHALVTSVCQTASSRHNDFASSITFGECQVRAPRMATPSFAPVGNGADSTEPGLSRSPATGHDAEILDVNNAYLGYHAENFPYQQTWGRCGRLFLHGRRDSPRHGILYSGGELTRPCLGNIRSTSTQSRTAPRKEPAMRESQRV